MRIQENNRKAFAAFLAVMWDGTAKDLAIHFNALVCSGITPNDWEDYCLDFMSAFKQNMSELDSMRKLKEVLDNFTNDSQS